ncbi:MAG: hypothetical protein RLZZ65_1836 [Bacteroidota bacterium]|jgi:hypothetical protein
MRITTKLKSLHFLAVVLMLLSSGNLLAQLTGTKTIPGNYATIAAAITDLNTQGVGTGGVTFNVASGYTESTTAPLIITATGTAASPIVFQKSGSGANPVITRTDAGTLNSTVLGAQADAIVIIDGSDYLSFNAINVTASTAASSTTGIEYGYYLRKVSGTNGCKNVSITNCAITMSKGTSAVVTGIMSSNNDALSTTTTATGIAVTSIGGRNENLTFNSNIISNVHVGIYQRGYSDVTPYNFYDLNITANGNTIQNYGGGAASAAYAVYGIYYNSFAINNNIINNTAGGGSGFTSTGYGIFLSSSSEQGVCSANGNTITLAHAASTTASSIYAIYLTGSSSGTTGSCTANTNTLSFGQTGSGYVYGVYLYGNNPVNTINGNTLTFTVNKPSSYVYGYYMYYAGTISNNSFSGLTFATGGYVYGYYSPYNGACQMFNNTFSNITNLGTGFTYGYYLYYGNASSNIYNNTASNISGGGVVYGIYSYYSGAIKVYNNNISGLTSTGAYNVAGLAIYYTQSGAEYYKNKITNLTNTNAGGTAYGISDLYHYGNIKIYNNVIGDIKATIATNASTPTADVVRGISLMNTLTNSSVNVDYNTIYLNATSTGANFSTSGIYHASSATATTENLLMRNNIVVNLSTPTGAGVIAAFRRATATQLNNFDVNSNNNMLFAGTPSATRVIYMEGTAVQQTLANYKTLVTPRDAYSMTGEAFTYSTAGSFFISLTPSSVDYLKPVNGITTQVEGGALQISEITDDKASVVRAGNAGYTGTGVAPDRGAFEFTGITTAPQITLSSSSPSISTVSCTPTAHVITLNIASPTAVTTAVLSYAFNGVAQPNITLTNTSGTIWTGTIPTATPSNATVTWTVNATNSSASTLFIGQSYFDAPLVGVTATATATPSTVCAGQSTLLAASFNMTVPSYDSPTISLPVNDEDIANVTITQGATTLLNNTSPINSLGGTIGTAVGVAGGFADYSALATVNLVGGQTYSFSISSQTTGSSYSNSLAIFIDWNKNGLFSDAGEMVYTPTSTISGPHTRTGTFTVPTWAFGNMRMRVVCLETTISSYATTSSYGEREDYMLSVVGTVSWAQGATVVGTANPLSLPVTSTSSYVATIGALGCTVAAPAVTVTVLALPTAPVVTNSTHCGFQIPTASVASVNGGGGTAQFNWYTDPATTISAQGSNYGALATYWSNDFTSSTLSNATLSGVASVTGGQLVLHPNLASQSGGITVNASGYNTNAHEVSFTYTNQGAGVANTADGMAFSFGDDVNALAATPNAENGTGTKLKIAFDSYANGTNTPGIYLMYNCTVANQDPTSTGVLAYDPTTTWIGATSNVLVTINAAGVLNMSVNGTPLFTNVQLPAAFVTANKANWAYVWRSRSGGIASGSILDDIVIKRAPIVAGPTTYGSIVSATTTFYVTENGTNGCISAPVPVVVTVTAPPAINIATSVTPTICLGSSVTLTASATATPAYTYSWSTASYPGSGMSAPSTGATRSLTPTVAGTYVYTVTGTNANCANQVQQTVLVNPIPVVTTTTAAAVTPCHGSLVNLNVSSLVSGPQTQPTGYCASNATNTADEEILNVTFGTLNNSSTCATTGGAGSTLNQYSNYTATVAAPNIIAGYTYPLSVQIGTCGGNYSNSVKVFIDLNRDGDFLDAGETVYASAATTTGPHTETASILIPTTGVVPGVTRMRVISVETSPASINSCGTYTWGETEDYIVNLQTGPSAVYTYAWNTTPAINAASGSLTLSNTGVTPTTASYNVTLTDVATGCTTTSTTNTITINPLPVVNAGVDQLICSNNATMPATLTATTTFGSGLNYIWSGPIAGVTNGVPFQIGATGTFVVTSTDVNGCMDTDDVQITYSTIPAANAGVDQAICLNQSATFTAAGLAPYNWTMTNYANSGLSAAYTGNTLAVTPTAAGTYTYQVNVQNSVGCTNNDQAVLTVWALPVVNAGVDQTICNASPAIVSGSGALAYAWTTTHPNLTVTNATPIFPIQTATYTVVGTDIHGCQNQDVMVVNVLPQPVVNAGLDQTICAGTPVILNGTTTISSPTPVVSPFTWTGGYANNTQFVPTTSQTMTVSVIGANGCTNQDQMVITVLALPTVNAGVDQTICTGTGATLNASGAASYIWSNNVVQGVPFYPTASQIYTVTGIGANGCSNVDQVQVNVSTGPSVTVSAAQTVCSNNAAAFSAASQNALGGYWTTTGSGTITPNISSAAINYLPAANDPVVVTLTYIATSACGSAGGSTSVNVLPIPVINAGPDQTICDGSSVTLNAAGTGNITWLSPNVNNGFAFVPTSTATYTAVATGLNNCTNQDQVTVTVVALPVVDAGADQTICAGEQVTLSGSGALVYQWTGGIADGTAFAPGSTATYTVTGTTVNGCTDTDAVTVTVNATPVAVATVVNDVTLAATPGTYNYQWINCTTGTDVPNASFATFNALANGTYAVVVSTPQGCSDQSDCITISAVGIEQNVTIEMGVQPNPTTGELTISMPTELNAKAQVFDAQGKLVIDQVNVSNGSTLNLTNMTTGVYMVRISAADSVQTFRVVKQ